MKKETKDQILKVLEESNIDIEWSYYIDFDNLEIDGELSEQIRKQIEDSDALNVEIYYYSNAIKFLQEKDPSLTESLEIANEFGYDLENIDSELLASLLASQMLRENFSDNFPADELDEIEEEFCFNKYGR